MEASNTRLNHPHPYMEGEEDEIGILTGSPESFSQLLNEGS
jgi:hypothetical protein